MERIAGIVLKRISWGKKFISYQKDSIELDAVADCIKLHHS